MSRSVKITGGLLLGIVVVALLAPLVSPHDYDQTNFDALLQAPAVDLVQFAVEPLREQFQVPVANVYLHGSRLTS